MHGEIHAKTYMRLLSRLICFPSIQLARQREQRAQVWERNRTDWLESVRIIGDNWRSELGREIERTREEIEQTLDVSTARRRATDIYMSLPVEILKLASYCLFIL